MFALATLPQICDRWPVVKPSATNTVEVLTAEEVAQRLKITRVALRNATSRGHVPRGVQIPGLGLRWDRAEFEDWLRRRLDECR